MARAHIFGIPVEETALAFAPVILAVIAAVRVSGCQLRRKVRRRGHHPIRERHT
jgi:hypothetical protein